MAEAFSLPQAAVLAVSRRDPVIESVHYGQVAAADPEGRLVAAWGDPAVPVVLRSCAKPLQALAVITSGAADRFGLEPRHLAICCASHSGSALHLQTVAEILDRLGLADLYLGCGVHWPSDRAEFDRLKRAGLSPGPLHNNCSGKHAGMLATALALGTRPEGYLDPVHPVQALIRRHLALLSGVDESSLVPLPDGCGAPTYALPLRSVARAFACLVSGQGLPEDLRQAVRRVTAATAGHPEMVQAEGGFNTVLLRETQGRVIAKGGAEGLFALGLKEEALGLAVKVSDGASRPWAPVVVALLNKRLEPLSPDLAGLARAEQVNCHGTVVGRVEAHPALFGLLPSKPSAEEVWP